MEKLKRKAHRLRYFFRRRIWEIDEGGLSPCRRFLLRRTQFAILIGREFIADRCVLRASALTYVTLLSLVPLFALAFAVLSGLGVQNTLEPLILEKLTVGTDELVDEIVTYINNTDATRLGTVGLVTLVMTVVALLSNVESSFNNVWGVKETRPLLRRFADYTSVVLLGPLFLVAAISMTSTLQSQTFVQGLMEEAVVGRFVIFCFRVLPFLAMWAAFIFLYVFMPNIKVRLPAAVIGGIFGGTLWQLAQWFYVNFQVGVARYNAIYGTLAAVPILMVWIYLSWIIVLMGAEVAYVWQNQTIIRREIREEKVNFLSQEMVALTILAAVTAVFERGEKPWGMERIASHLKLPPRLTRTVIDELVHLGYLAEVREEGDEQYHYQPAKPPGKVQVHKVIETFRRSGASLRRHEEIPEWGAVWELERRLVRAEMETMAGMTLEELAGGKGSMTDDG